MKRYISAGQLAERYGVDKSTVWRWAQRKILPAPVKLSEQSTRWDPDAVERGDAERAGREA